MSVLAYNIAWFLRRGRKLSIMTREHLEADMQEK